MLGKYIYGIVRNQDLDQTLRKEGLSAVSFRRLSAVTANAEYRDYHNLPKEDVVRDLTSHQQMIEKIMEQFAVLPVKFGTILKDEEEVRSVLKKGYSFLWDTLLKMEDKIELDLVCFWNEQKAAQTALQESKRVQILQEQLANKKGNAADEDKIALGKEIAKFLGEKRGELSNQILGVLKKVASGSCNHTLADVNMLLNQAFLVNKDSEERFNRALNRLDSKFADLVNFRLVGPLPPYSFATVVVDALDKEEIENAKKLLNPGGQINKDSVKKAYDKLAFKLHPDHGGNPAEFESVTQSYQCLRKFTEQGLVGVYLHRWEER